MDWRSPPSSTRSWTSSATSARAVLITGKKPRAWESGNNALLRGAAKRYPNAALMDWRAAATPHPAWFYDDGIHLQPAGATAFEHLVAQAIAAP